MSLKLTYYGQNDSVNCTPAVFLTGDPGTDQQTLTSAGYLGGVIVALIDSAATLTAPLAFQSSYEPAFGSIGNIVPCDTNGTLLTVQLREMSRSQLYSMAPANSLARLARLAPARHQLSAHSGRATLTIRAMTQTVPSQLGQYLYCGETEPTPTSDCTPRSPFRRRQRLLQQSSRNLHSRSDRI